MKESDKINFPEKLFTNKFSCDLNICKGACCTSPGGNGAPLKFEEVEILQKIYPIVKNYLSPKHIDFIELNNFYENNQNNFSTKCLPTGQCAFVFFQNEIAYCSIEKAFRNNEIDFQKPISCALFPVRLKDFNSTIELEYFDACSSAFDKGEKENVKLNSFLDIHLTRALGDDWNNVSDDYLKSME